MKNPYFSNLVISAVALVMFLVSSLPSFALASSGPWVMGLDYSNSEDGNTSAPSSVAKMNRFKSVVATVTDVNTSNNTITIRSGVFKRVIDVSTALIVVIDSDSSAHVRSVSDLRTGAKVHAFVMQQPGRPWSTLVGSLVIQLSDPKLTPSPTALPTVQFSANGAAGGEASAAYSIPLVLSRASQSDIYVSYTVSGNAMGGGVDYSLPATATMRIPAGQTSVMIPLSLVNDNLDEVDENIVVRLSTATNAVVGSRDMYTFTINDANQPRVSFDVDSHTIVEATAMYQHTVFLSKTASHDVRVHYTVSGTATAGLDYSLPSGELVIPAGSSSGSINLNVYDDSTREATETVIITLSDPTNASMGAITVHTHTILDND